MNQRQQINQILKGAGLSPGTYVRSAVISQRAESGGDDDGFLWTLATEMPAVIFDWDRYEFVEEVLLMDGMLTPAVGQVPLLDSHNRMSVDDVLGSVREFSESTAGQFAARDGLVLFAADERSQRTRQKVADRHLLDGSVGYRVHKSVWIPEDSEASVLGTIYEGPLKVSYSWTVKEFSITPIGADVLAKVRLLLNSGEG